MKRPVLLWSVILAVMMAICLGIILSGREESKPAVAVPAPELKKRDPSQVTDLEMELILNKIREGDILAMQKNLAGAKAAWTEARRLGQALWPIHEGLGDSYARMELRDEAIKEYHVAEALIPDRLFATREDIARKRARLLEESGRPLAAARTYIRNADPALVEEVVLDLADRKTASEMSRLLKERAEREDPRLYRALWQLETRRGRNNEAAEALARYNVEVVPWDEELNEEVIRVLKEDGKIDLAIEVANAWARSLPGRIRPYELMGDLYREAGREREAYVAYTSIVDVRAGDAEAHRRLGAILARLNRRDEAIAQFETARKARPEDRVTYHALMELYEENGDRKRSQAILIDLMKRFGAKGERGAQIIAQLRRELAAYREEGLTQKATEVRHTLGQLGVLDEGLFDIKIIMTWDAKSDVDLDIDEPDGTHLDHGNTRSSSGGFYHTDNTKAYGPEFYTIKDARPGTYKVGAHLHSGGRSNVSFVVILYEGTEREERRTESFVLEKKNDKKFIRSIQIKPGK